MDKEQTNTPKWLSHHQLTLRTGHKKYQHISDLPPSSSAPSSTPAPVRHQFHITVRRWHAYSCKHRTHPLLLGNWKIKVCCLLVGDWLIGLWEPQTNLFLGPVLQSDINISRIYFGYLASLTLTSAIPLSGHTTMDIIMANQPIGFSNRAIKGAGFAAYDQSWMKANYSIRQIWRS